jgi:pimeloyl-ACP methyl ester carboxylesterase
MAISFPLKFPIGPFYPTSARHMNDLIKKAVISKIAFQPPYPPSYKENKDVIWLECKHSKKKHNNVKDPKYEKVLIPAIFMESKNSDQVILYSHGNATDLGQMLPYLQLLNTALKINVFGYDYQGYGISKPKGRSPSEKRVNESITVCCDYLMTVKKFPAEKIIVFGCSLGSGATVFLASNSGIKDKETKHKFRGVILQSAFISGLKTKLKVEGTIPFDIFPNLERVQHIECPTFLIHGKSDEIVPFEHALMLNKKLKFPYSEQLHIAYAGHNNIIEVLSVERYVKKLYNFVKYLNGFHEEKKEEVHSGLSMMNMNTVLSVQDLKTELSIKKERVKSLGEFVESDSLLDLPESPLVIPNELQEFIPGAITGDRETGLQECSPDLFTENTPLSTPNTTGPNKLEDIDVIINKE